MYILIAGGGKVGRYLTGALLAQGHEVLLIERNEAKVRAYIEQFGEVVRQGDSCEASVLDDAGARRADVVVAVTGDDEDNLVICQMAKRKFGVPRTIARVNNPKNRLIMQRLGIDDVISQTEVVGGLLIQKIAATPAALQTLPLQAAPYQVLAIRVAADSPLLNQPLGGVDFPKEANVLVILRDGKIVVPRTDERFQTGDDVIVLAHATAEERVRAFFRLPAEG